MKKNTKILCIFLVMILLFTLVGCTKCISTEETTVKVKITDSYHRSSYMVPVYNGKTRTYITQPAIYRIYVEYDGFSYTITGSDTYNKYQDKVGEYVNGILETKKYDDGTVKYEIIGLE